MGNLIFFGALAVIAAMLYGGFRYSRGPRIARPATPADPRCGKCGYIVRGIMSLTCPECGGDLREVGIDVGKTNRPGWKGVVGGCFVWTATAGIVAGVAGDEARRLFPRWGRVTLATTMTQPASRAYFTVAISGYEDCRWDVPTTSFPVANRQVEITTPDGRASVMDVDLHNDSYRYKATAGQGSGGAGTLGAPAVLAWMKDAGIDTSRADVIAEAGEICAAMRPPPGGHVAGGAGWNSSSSGRVYSHFNNTVINANAMEIRSPWPSAILLGAWLALWLAGVWWIVKRYGPKRRT